MSIRNYDFSIQTAYARAHELFARATTLEQISAVYKLVTDLCQTAAGEEPELLDLLDRVWRKQQDFHRREANRQGRGPRPRSFPDRGGKDQSRARQTRSETKGEGAPVRPIVVISEKHPRPVHRWRIGRVVHHCRGLAKARRLRVFRERNWRQGRGVHNDSSQCVSAGAGTGLDPYRTA